MDPSYFNGSIWDLLEGDSASETRPTVASTVHGTDWAGVGSGVGVLLVALIGVAVAVRRNLEAVEGLLNRLQLCLTTMTSLMRREESHTTAAPPTAHSAPVPWRNPTDSTLIEMREMEGQDCPPPPERRQTYL